MILAKYSTIYSLVLRTGGHLDSVFENPIPQWNHQPEAHFYGDESVHGCEENLQILQLLALKNNLVPYGTLLESHFLLLLPFEMAEELKGQDCLKGSFPQSLLHPFFLFQHSQMIQDGSDEGAYTKEKKKITHYQPQPKIGGINTNSKLEGTKRYFK